MLNVRMALLETLGHDIARLLPNATSLNVA